MEDAMTKALDAVEARAQAARVPMTDLCRQAGVSYSTWYRCRGGHNSMRWKTVDKLERRLNAIEAERASA